MLFMARDSLESKLIQAVEEEVEDLASDYAIDGPNIEDIRVEDLYPEDDKLRSGGHQRVIDREPIRSELVFSEGLAENLDEHPRYEDTLRDIARHEAAHSLHHLHLENIGENPGGHPGGPRNIEKSYLEAFAKYETDMRGSNKDRTFQQSASPYNTFGGHPLSGLPNEWSNNSDENNEPDDAHTYGKIAADLIEKSYLKDSDLEQAQNKTRRTLIDISSHDELEEETRAACQRMDIPYFGDIICEERDRLEAYMEGDEYWKIPDEGFNKIMLLEGKDALEKEVEQAYETLEEGADSLEEHYRANATLQVADTFGVEPETSPSKSHTNRYISQATT